MINKVILVGRLGQDPEIKQLESGSTVANLTLATSERYKDRSTGERKEITEWHDLEMWEGLAKVAENYLKKGSLVYIEGRIKTEKWVDKESNSNRSRKKIRVVNMQMLDGRNEDSPASSNSAPIEKNEPTLVEKKEDTSANDDLPF